MGGLRFGEFEFRADERVLTRRGQPVRLGARAYDILSYLIDHRDRVVSKAELSTMCGRGLPSRKPTHRPCLGPSQGAGQ